LGDRVDIAVGAEEGGDQEGAAEQALGVAHSRRGHIDARTLRRERRQGGRHHDRGHVPGTDLLAADIDTEPHQHPLQGLLGERGIVQRVAGCVEADDETVADELVLPDALDVGEVLDARGRSRRRYGGHEYGQRCKRNARRP
jgi:hypothetical protein